MPCNAGVTILLIDSRVSFLTMICFKGPERERERERETKRDKHHDRKSISQKAIQKSMTKIMYL